MAQSLSEVMSEFASELRERKRSLMRLGDLSSNQNLEDITRR